MTAILARVALASSSLTPDSLSAGVRALAGFAPFGADRVDEPWAQLWAARSRNGSMLAAADGCVIAIDGHLRDRTAFLRQHDLPATLDDASALLRLYRRKGVDFINALDADLALMLIDRAAARCVLYRDLFGERGLRLASNGTELCIATRATAVCALRGEAVVADERAITHFFALRAPPDDVSWIRGVRELAAGECLVFEQGREQPPRQERFAQPEPLRFQRDADAIDAWRQTLDGAITRAYSRTQHPGVMLSGGIDSTLLATIAAPRAPLALSWALPAWPACDESGLAAATAASLHIEHAIVPGDALQPLAPIAPWPVEDDAPLANPYRWLNQALFAEARQRGIDLLISGNFGDHIYADRRDWASSLRAERGNAAMLSQLRMSRRVHGLANLLRDPGLRGLFRANTGPTPAPPWLSANARRELNDGTDRHDATAHRRAQLLGRASTQDAELARRFATQHGIELAFPYRDPAVVRFALALPAHYSDSPRGAKWLSRELLVDSVPDAVRLRPKSGSLAPFFRDGVMRIARDQVLQLVHDRDARWPQFVQQEALALALNEPRSESALLLIWLVICYELWWRAHEGVGPAVLASAVSQPGISNQ